MRSRIASGNNCWILTLTLVCSLLIVQKPGSSQETLTSQESLTAMSAAERGYHLLRTVPYGKADLLVDHFDQLWHYWPEDIKKKAETASEVERRRLAFERYGMIPDPDNPEGSPLGVVDDQQGGWVMNCLSCHQGTVDGNLVWGAGNNRFAFQTLVDDVVKLLDRSGQTGNPMMKLLELGSTNGTTNAQVFSILLSSLRDRDLNRTLLPKPIQYVNHDLDAPPLWNVKFKKNLYIDGYIPKNHRVIMQFTLVPGNTGREIKQLEDGFRDVLAWIESLEAPVYPRPVDQELAMKGESVFQRVCADCHGTYGQEQSYPEIRIPIAELGTDSVRLTGMPPEHRRFIRESWFGNYGQLNVVEDPEGYIAPPLNGIWASAPYLHNGSIPTLWHLMNADERPQVWKRKSENYDWQQLGVDIERFDSLPSDIRFDDERRNFFDTSLKGKSARGHEYPEQLDRDEKLAVLEYLKTL